MANSVIVATYAERCPLGRWSYLDLVVRKSGMGLTSTSQMVNGIEFIFQATSPLERGELKRKGGGKKTILFNRSEETVELILRTVISVNQLSI